MICDFLKTNIKLRHLDLSYNNFNEKERLQI